MHSSTYMTGEMEVPTPTQHTLVNQPSVLVTLGEACCPSSSGVRKVNQLKLHMPFNRERGRERAQQQRIVNTGTSFTKHVPIHLSTQSVSSMRVSHANGKASHVNVMSHLPPFWCCHGNMHSPTHQSLVDEVLSHVDNVQGNHVP